jgi:hypothetical protein
VFIILFYPTIVTGVINTGLAFAATAATYIVTGVDGVAAT